MNCYVGLTDYDWFTFLSARRDLDEVNFWRPGGKQALRALRPGEPFLFKLHSPRNFIVGGGLFSHFSFLPTTLAWDAFGEKNGAPSLPEMRSRIEKYRRAEPDARADYTIGCILLEGAFFFDESDWIPAPPDWPRQLQTGKTYDTTVGEGRLLWERVELLLRARPARPSLANQVAEPPANRYGSPALVAPRLGQGTFRIVVTDAYARRCAVTGERTLPVLEAAHIMPFAAGGPHTPDNGLLLRSDVHTLFDRGYVTVTPEHRLEVSARIREEFENGRDYYALHGKALSVPHDSSHQPSRSFLEWHVENVYLG